MKIRPCWPALLALLGLLLPAGTALAGGFSNLDMGVRRMGMLAVTAKPDDGTAIYHNPAGLTLLEGTHFYHSQSWFIVDLGIKLYDSEGKLRPDYEMSPEWNVGAIPVLAVSSDLGTERFRLAMGIYAPNAYGAKLPKDEPTRYHATDALFLAARASVAAAYEITDRLSIGAAVSLIYVHLTASRFMNASVLANPDLRFLPPEETAAGDAELAITGRDLTFGWDVGLLFKPLDTLYIGFKFSSGAPITLRGDVKLTNSDGTVERAKHVTSMVIPFELRAGINWEFVKDWELGLDVYWWHYQVFQDQRTILSQPIMGIGEFRDPKNYGNSLNWCIGLLYRIHPAVELMFGFQEDYTPIPDATFTLENPSRNQKGISFGVRWQVLDNLRLGLAFVRNWFELPDIQESISTPPSNAKGHGGNTEFGFDLLWQI